MTSSISPVVPAQPPKGVLDITSKYLSISGVKNLFKSISCASQWLTYASPKNASALKNISNLSNDAKNFLLFPEVVTKGNDFRKGINKFWKEKSIVNTKKSFLNGGDIVSKFALWVGTFAEGISFLSKRNVVSLTAQHLKVCTSTFNVAGLVSSSWGVYKEADKLSHSKVNDPSLSQDQKNIEIKKNTKSMITLAQMISYLVLGALWVASVAFSVVASPILILALSTTAVVSSISSHFYEKLNPEAFPKERS